MPAKYGIDIGKIALSNLTGVKTPGLVERKSKSKKPKVDMKKTVNKKGVINIDSKVKSEIQDVVLA